MKEFDDIHEQQNESQHFQPEMVSMVMINWQASSCLAYMYKIALYTYTVGIYGMYTLIYIH